MLWICPNRDYVMMVTMLIKSRWLPVNSLQIALSTNLFILDKQMTLQSIKPNY